MLAFSAMSGNNNELQAMEISNDKESGEVSSIEAEPSCVRLYLNPAGLANLLSKVEPYLAREAKHLFYKQNLQQSGPHELSCAIYAYIVS